MPSKRTLQQARKDLREGKSPTTAAGEFVHEEIRHVRTGKHGARSAKQAIAIGLSKARRAGVPLPPPAAGTTSKGTRRKAQQDLARGRRGARTAGSGDARRARATAKALEHEPRSSVSHEALSRQARQSARRKGSQRRRSAS